MADNSTIEWCDATFNPWIGCTKVGPGCDNCYAEREFDHRRHRAKWGAGQERSRTSAANWNLPRRWNRQHEQFFVEQGRRRRVFCASLADVFDNEVPDQWRIDLLRLIADTPNLDWLLLTKRIGSAQRMMVEAFRAGWPNHVDMWDRWPELFKNIWLGATIVNQAEADRDIPKLFAVPATVRWLSMEPLLGPVDLRHLNKDRETNEIDALKPWTWEQEIEAWRGTSDTWEEDFEDWHSRSIGELSGPCHNRIDWVVVGGESGPHARPMHPDWTRSLRDQCVGAGIPFLFKQWGEWCPIKQVPKSTAKILPSAAPHNFFLFERGVGCSKVGKKLSGRLLDGIEHNGYPEAS